MRQFVVCCSYANGFGLVHGHLGIVRETLPTYDELVAKLADEFPGTSPVITSFFELAPPK
jgi:hypothetical protein